MSGSGDSRIAVADGQVGFSLEAPRWQVIAEADAEGIVTEIAAQIGAATGQPSTRK